MLLRTTLIPNSYVQGQRLLLFDIPVQHQLFVSCYSCLRRCCTLSGAVHRTVRFRMEKADAMTFCSQFDPQTSVWFDHSTEDSSRTVSYLIRRLRSALRGVASRRSSSPLQLYVQSSFLIQQLRNINIAMHPFPEFNNVELHRPTVRSPVQTNSFQHSSKAVHPSPCPSTMSNSIDTPRSRYATVSRVQQCRTPSTANVMYVKSSNVELLQFDVRYQRQPSPHMKTTSTHRSANSMMANRQLSTVNRQHRCRIVKL